MYECFPSSWERLKEEAEKEKREKTEEWLVVWERAKGDPKVAGLLKKLNPYLTDEILGISKEEE